MTPMGRNLPVKLILIAMAKDELDQAADLAEYRLGMSSLQSHGASHMAKFMPKGHASYRHRHAPRRKPLCPGRATR